MSEMNIKETKVWVDAFTSDLFFNANHDNFDALDGEATEQEAHEALVKDAEEFIEVIAQSFNGISIDHEPETYAKNYWERL
jgi:hypothetical protein|tara:strand:- start:5724 stop:5966 length:243 start_codon:yes stop_codon:yes gene_type:complete